MVAPALARSRLRVWAAALLVLAAPGCGRVGYDRVSLLDGASPDRPLIADLGPDTTIEAGPLLDAGPTEVRPPDLGLPDARVDLAVAPDLMPVADRAPDLAPDLRPDLPPDRAPDQAPDVGPPPTPPAFATARTIAETAADLVFAINTGSGSDRYLLVGLALETETRNVTAISFAGRPLTRLAADTSGACGSFMYGLVNPPPGSDALVINLDGGSDIVAVAATFTGVRQTTSQGGTVTRAASEGAIQVVLPSAPGDQVVDILCLDDGSERPRPGAGQTQRGGDLVTTFEAAMSNESGAASVTMSWGFGGTSVGWALVAVGLKPAGAMAVRLERREMFALGAGRYPNSPGSGPVVRGPKLSAAPPNRL